jgi:pilus assembly protein Flp/PilA
MRTVREVSAAFIRMTRCERGATAVEYAIVAAGVAVAISAAVYALGDAVEGQFITTQEGLEQLQQ